MRQLKFILWLACIVGPSSKGRLISVVFTLRDGRIRPISARPASRKELKQVAHKKGVPYQVLMRLLIADGLKRMKAA